MVCKTVMDSAVKPEEHGRGLCDPVELEQLRKQLSAKDLVINLLQQRLQSSPPAATRQAPWADSPRGNQGWQGPTLPARSTLSEVCAAAQAARKQAAAASSRVAWHDEITEECQQGEKSMEDELLAMQHRLETQEKEAGDLRGGMAHLQSLMAEKDREIKKMQLLLGELQATMTPRGSTSDSVSQSLGYSAVTATFGKEEIDHSPVVGGERTLHDKLRWLEQQIHGRSRGSSSKDHVQVRTVEGQDSTSSWSTSRVEPARSSCQPFAPEGRNPMAPRRTKPQAGAEKVSLAAWISGASATASAGASTGATTPRVREGLPKRAASSAVPAAECRPLPEHRINYGQPKKVSSSSFSGPSAKPTIKSHITVEGTVTPTGPYRAVDGPSLSGSGRVVRSHSTRVRAESPSKVARCMTRSDSQPRYQAAKAVHVEALTPRRSVEVKPPCGWSSVAGSCSTPTPGPSVVSTTVSPIPASPRRSAMTPRVVVGADAASAATAAAAFARASAPVSARVVSSASARRHINRSLSPPKGGPNAQRPLSPRPITSRPVTPVPSQQVVSAKQITVQPGIAYGSPAPSYCVGTATPMRPTTTTTYVTPPAPTPPSTTVTVTSAPWSARWS